MWIGGVKMYWTKEEAKTYLLNYHNINTDVLFTLEDVFKRMKLVQFDPLNVVGTNAELVLQSRILNFNKDQLSNALYQSRFLVDGWDKQMCIYESEYIPHYTRVRQERSAATERDLVKYFDYDVHSLTDEIYHIIQQEGPMFSAQIHSGSHVEYYWSKSKTSTITIDYLFHRGLIGVYNRKNTQKQYVDMKTIYPNIEQPDPFTNEQDFTDFLLYRRIQSCGLIRNKNSHHLNGLTISNKDNRSKSLQRLIQQGLVTEIAIEGFQEPFYLPTNTLHLENRVVDQISFIAPLDNLVWDRTILMELFDFDYIWEVYTPKAKRKWGYYVLPIVRGNNFIGRIEFANYRSNQPLQILSVLWEPGIAKTKKLDALFHQALKRFCNYLGAKTFVYLDETEIDQ